MSGGARSAAGPGGDATGLLGSLCQQAGLLAHDITSSKPFRRGRRTDQQFAIFSLYIIQPEFTDIQKNDRHEFVIIDLWEEIRPTGQDGGIFAIFGEELHGFPNIGWRKVPDIFHRHTLPLSKQNLTEREYRLTPFACQGNSESTV
jgi:hypothetical protein